MSFYDVADFATSSALFRKIILNTNNEFPSRCNGDFLKMRLTPSHWQVKGPVAPPLKFFAEKAWLRLQMIDLFYSILSCYAVSGICYC